MMFGMMLELVYARKVARRGGMTQDIVSRLIRRSLQCYAGYVVTVAAGWLVGLFDGAHAIQAAVFIFGAHHGNILKFYAVAILVAIPLLAFRHRYGLKAAIGVCLAVWACDPLFDALATIHIGRFGGIRSLITGDVLHGLTFIAAGMFLGNALRKPAPQRRRVFFRHAAWIVACCSVVIAILVLQASPTSVYHSYLDFWEYRVSHHIGYYSIGLLKATLVAVGLYVLLPPTTQWLSPKAPALSFGRASLLSFTVGNVLLNLMYGQWEVGVGGALAIIAGYLVVMVVMVNGMERGVKRLKHAERLPWITHLRAYVHHRVVEPPSRYVMRRLRAAEAWAGDSEQHPQRQVKAANRVAQ
jgi:hypothetical protein